MERCVSRLFFACVLLSAASSCKAPTPLVRSAIVIDWPQTAINSRASDRKLVELVALRHFGYSALSEEQRRRMHEDLLRSRIPATIDQAVCVRNLLYKLQLDAQREVLSPVDIVEHYERISAGNVATCAAFFQTAPLEVVRAVVRLKYQLSGFLTRKVVELTISFIAEDATAAAELLDYREHLVTAAADKRLPAHSKRDMARFARSLTVADWEQFVWACQHDMQGRPKQLTMDDAEAGERLLGRHLRACGARFRTERDLRLEQDEHRRSTPDILFDEGASVCVGQQRGVRWIDMKNMYGTVSCGPASDALVEQLASKAARYTSDWGRGAFVLKYGFCEALQERLQDVMGADAELVSLLSADSLPGAPPQRSVES